jgi:CysZ protein
MKKIIDAIKDYGKAFSVINRHSLWGWVLVPGILFVLLAIPTYIFITGWIGGMGFGEVDTIANEKAGGIWAKLLHALAKIGKVASYIAGIFVFMYTYKFIYLIVCSPILGLLSEKAEERMLGTNYSFTAKQLMIDIWRGLRISLRNALKQIILFVIFLLLSFIPVIGVFFSMLLLLLDCYYFGFGMLDYNSERHKLGYGESVLLIKKNKSLALGNGIGLYLILLIPVVGWVIGPGISAVAAMITYIKNFKPNLLPK